MSKLPFMQFYPADWLQDTSCLSLEAQGAWMRLICAMWVAPERGKLDWTLDQFQNFLGLHRVDATEVWNELQSSGVGEFYFQDGAYDAPPPGVPQSALSADRVTLVCRRIQREESKRKQVFERVKRHRNKNVTQKKRSIYHISEVRSHISEEDKSTSFAGANGNGVSYQTKELTKNLAKTKDLGAKLELTVGDLADSWNEVFKGWLPAVTLPLSTTRKEKALHRLHEHPSLAFWQHVFDNISASKFLMGGVDRKNHPSWHCTFDFLIGNKDNCLKIYEGNYLNGN